jgi:flagellar M-ring protein FliF
VPATSRRESVVNYEVDKTVKVVREATGTVKRLSAAVVVNHRTRLDQGRQGSHHPDCARATGTDDGAGARDHRLHQTRGDSVNLVNAPFNDVKPSSPSRCRWWQQQVQDLARSLAWPAGMVLLGLHRLPGHGPPGAASILKAPPAPIREVTPLNALVNEQPERPGLPMPSEVAEDTARTTAPHGRQAPGAGEPGGGGQHRQEAGSMASAAA